MDHCLIAAHGLVGDSNARLDGGLVQLDSNTRVRGDADRARSQCRAVSSNQQLPGRKVEVRLTILILSFRRDEGPRDTKVQGQIVGDAPIVLNEGAKQLPAPAGCSAI